MKTVVVIPALDEEQSIGLVLGDLPGDRVDEVIVVDNGSGDRTAEVASEAGARVVEERERGYGSACLRGIAALPEDAGLVVFIDADYSDHPDELPLLVEPIVAGEADLVIGSRLAGDLEPGAMPLPARFGNRLAVLLMRLFWGIEHTDLGPFRAIRRDALERIGMRDRNFGWTIEMQIKAHQRGLRVVERPVSYRRRVGASKISGTVTGVIRAGTKIIYTIFKERFRPDA